MAEATTKKSKSTQSKPSDAQQAAPHGKRILLVDDDQEIVESMRLALTAKGYQVLAARDGNKGLVL